MNGLEKNRITEGLLIKSKIKGWRKERIGQMCIRGIEIIQVLGQESPLSHEKVLLEYPRGTECRYPQLEFLCHQQGWMSSPNHGHVDVGLYLCWDLIMLYDILCNQVASQFLPQGLFNGKQMDQAQGHVVKGLLSVGSSWYYLQNVEFK